MVEFSRFFLRLSNAVLLAFIFIPPLAGADKPNVLFIAVDDLNHWVHHLGRNAQTRTPNIDRLAARGVTFARAYCAAPACNPSRAALLSGKRPSTTGVYHNPDDWRPHVPIEQTLPSHFRRNGYYVAGAGKIYHGGFNRPAEWEEYRKKGTGTPKPKGKNLGVGGIKFAPLDCRDEDMDDYQVVSWIIEKLEAKRDRPFFLACGIFRPHMPWNVPRKYYELYPLEGIELPPVDDTDLEDVPPAGVRMAKPQGDHAKMIASGRWKEAVQAYLASITFADAQVGRLLDALEKSPHATNTIIVLWGDHGWHLGEKLHWRKFALWEEATRAPLVWVAPGVTRKGGVCKRPVDFLSVYPTLVDLCDLPHPKHLEGTSIRTLLEDPSAEWSAPALTTHGFRNHALRSERWRYIRYADGSEELYDHDADPLERTNLATNPDFAETKTELARHLPEEDHPPLPRKANPRAQRRAQRREAEKAEKAEKAESDVR